MASDVFGGGLEPFGISPDPRFIYFDTKLRQEHQVLLDGLRKGIGLTVITGEHGVGKTMLLHCLAAELDVANHLVVYISCLGGPTVDDILDTFAVQIGFPGQSDDGGEGYDRISLAGMLGSVGVGGTTAILLLDDADRLTGETLSALSAMSRGDSKKGAAISIVLAGSPALAARLDAARNRFPERRLDLNISLAPLTPRDAESYVYHRLHMAGYGGSEMFSPEAIARVAHHAQGNPQAINRICRAAMVVAAGQSRKTVSVGMVDQVAPRAGVVRPPKTVRATQQHSAPRASEGLETIREMAMTADARHRGIPSRLEAGRSAFTPVAPEGAPERAPAGARGDNSMDHVLGGPTYAFDTAMPSGRDLTAQVAAAETKDVPRSRPRGFGWRRWAALGVVVVVLAVGAGTLYIFAGGDTYDRIFARVDVPAGIQAQNGEESPSSPTSLTASAPAREEPPEGELERPLPLERENATPPQTWGSPLEKAVFLGDINTVAALLDDGADINAPVAGGGTLLVVAADTGDEAMVSYLIGRGANPSFGTIGATDLGSDGLFPNFDDHADPRPSETGNSDATGAESAFSTAAGTGDAAIGESPDGHSRDKLGRELLLSTAGDGDRQRNRLTAPAGGELETQADLERSPNLGVTPLIAAARGGHADVVGVLLAAGAKVNVADTRGRTPLMAAVEAGDDESARLLLARDADVHAVDDTGRSALDRARQQSRWDLARLISARSEPVAADTTALRLSPDAQRTPSPDPQPATTDAGNGVASEPPRSEPRTAVERSAPRETPDRARVTRAQLYLSQLGYDPGPVDGVSGSKTASAVRAFQLNAGVKADGQITASLVDSLAAETHARQANRLAAETPAQGAPPKREDFFGSILSNFQHLRGLDFNSVENPAQLTEYCRKNSDNWIYDKGTSRSVYCKEVLRRSNL